MKRIATFSERLRLGLNASGMKATELSSITGISKSSISHYLKGDWEGKQDAVLFISKALNVSEAWLMGYDVPMERNEPQTITQPTSEDDELLLLLDELRNRPDMKMLFSVSKNCTPDEVRQAVKIIEALRKDDPYSE